MKAKRILFDHEPPKNILVRMPNWLGDCVMATPLLADLSAHFPQAKITVMCRGSVGALLEKNPHVNEILSFQKPSGWLHRNKRRDLLSPLQRGKYDLGILLTNSFSSAWIFLRGGVENRIGYGGNFRRLLLTRALPLPEKKEEQHLVVTYKMLLCCLGIPVSDTPPELFLSGEEREAARLLLQNHGVDASRKIVGINPGAAYGSAKCWLPERFREVARQLLQHPDIHVLFFGDRVGKPLVDEICRGLPDRVVNLAGETTIRQLMALLDCCDLLLTNDSGPMHMAAALQKPLVALFGSTNDAATGPLGSATVIHKHVSCSPCYLRECPIDFRCMQEITVPEVIRELNRYLENIRGSHAIR